MAIYGIGFGSVAKSRVEPRKGGVKIGSALLVDRASGALRADWLAGLAEDVAEARDRGTDVILVSSGSIALGRSALGLPNGSLPLEQSQAAAAASSTSRRVPRATTPPAPPSSQIQWPFLRKTKLLGLARHYWSISKTYPKTQHLMNGILAMVLNSLLRRYHGFRMSLRHQAFTVSL